MIAHTPPMGWNSWDCYGASVTEQTVRDNAAYMAANLKKFGWNYVVVDIQWSEPEAENHQYHPFTELEMDAFSRLIPAVKRFPSAADGAGFAPLAAYVHSLGLQFGIHIMRGIPRQAVHRNTGLLGTDATARQIADLDSICHWNTDMYGVNPTAEGAQAYYDSLFALYAAWGVDFVKVDDIANHYPHAEIEMIHRAMKNSGREMVLSLSPGPAPLEQAEHLKQYANMWRITDDFWDNWDQLYDMFSRAEKWCTHAGPGHWPDADMLPVGAILQDYDKQNRTKFTQDEQFTMLTLWCMMRSPLMVGGDLCANDAFTLALLTKPAVLEMLEQSRAAHQLYRREENGTEYIVWSAFRRDGGSYVALFNTSGQAAELAVSLAACEIDAPTVTLTELWTQTVQKNAAELRAEVPSHGVRVYYVCW